MNADIVARDLGRSDSASSSLAAGRLVLRRLDELIQSRDSFVYETTLSGNQPLDLMRKAKEVGYRIDLVFVVLTNVDLHVERVRQRVARGGHDIPESTIRRRYRTSLSRLPEALKLADECVVFDNTTPELAILARVRNGRLIEHSLDRSQPTHKRLDKILSAALRS